jgi:ElaA protein
MELVIKHFNELTLEELHDIYKLRVSIFIVEQNCPYQDIDGADKVAYHLYLKEDNEILAYLRVLPEGATYKEASIGRVVSARRREGLATRLLKEGIIVAKEKFDATTLTIGAQSYARKLYENVGFTQCSEEYLEDGIPHIHMSLNIED